MVIELLYFYLQFYLDVPRQERESKILAHSEADMLRALPKCDERLFQLIRCNNIDNGLYARGSLDLRAWQQADHGAGLTRSHVY